MVVLVFVAHAADPSAAERVAVASRVLVQVRSAALAGTASPEDVYRWSVRLMEAERDAGVLDAARSHAARMRDLASTVADQVSKGMAPPLALDMARFYEAEAAKGSDELASTRPPMPAPLPMPLPQPLPAPLTAPNARSGSIETCFQSCDAVHQTCARDAENFRLGIGALQPHAECDEAAAAKCGTGRSQSATDCRAKESRSCQAEKMAADCSRAQTQCAARCR